MAKDFTMKNQNGSGWDILHPKTNMSQVEGLDAKISEVEATAKGASRAKVYDTVAELDAWLAVAANKATLNVGDNFYIRATDVPDYWWDGTIKQPLEAEKVVLNNASTTADGLMSKSDKTKLEGIAPGAEVNVITAIQKNGVAISPSNKVVNISIPTKTSELTNDSGYKTTDTTYNNATTTTAGLMSATDKSKLDGIPVVTAGTTAPTNPKVGDIWFDYNNN